MPFIPVNAALERSFPAWLQDSIARFKDAYHAYKTNAHHTAFDCDILEFQSDINNAEVNGVISSDAAWYLREAYLGETKKDPEL